jgi:hypothetical protein
MTEKIKKYETIGCCGIDCGLCPRFHTKGDSVCPGCGGSNFKEKHPSCGFLTCCVIKNGLEVCSDCKDYPCKRFDSEKEGLDSFVTHRKIFGNLGCIKNTGIKKFIADQRVRVGILHDLLTNFDDGRSKNFYCISCTLLPMVNLQEAYEFALTLNSSIGLKEKCNLIKKYFTKIADSLNIELKLTRKK